MGAITPRSVGQGQVDTVTAEADDIGVAVVVDVRKQARVAVLAAPTAGAGTKGAEYKLRRPKIRRHASRRGPTPSRPCALDVRSGSMSVAADPAQAIRFCSNTESIRLAPTKWSPKVSWPAGGCGTRIFEPIFELTSTAAARWTIY